MKCTRSSTGNLQTMVLYNLLVACHVLNGLYDLYKMPLFFTAWDLNFFYSNSLGLFMSQKRGKRLDDSGRLKYCIHSAGLEISIILAVLFISQKGWKSLE